MTDNKNSNPFVISKTSFFHRRLRKRNNSEKLFKFLGFASIAISVIFLAYLVLTIFSKGYTSFIQTKIRVSVNISEYVDIKEARKDNKILNAINYRQIVFDSLKKQFPDAKSRLQVIQLYSLVSRNSFIQAQKQITRDFKRLKGNFKIKPFEVWVPASSNIDMFVKGVISGEEGGKISEIEKSYVKKLREEGRIGKFFNTDFLRLGDSREPEMAGIMGSMVGSIFVIIVCMLIALPLGVASATYLEEFAPKNKFTSIIEVSVNNLAAIPSIVYGLLGLAIFLNFFGLPRSASLVGGFTLALLVLPVIIVTTRNALASVPPSVRDAARGLGASKMQVVFHHVLPLAMPGIMTGSILSMARALGETAPLLMIGMVAFVRDIPQNFLDPATALPVQVFIWSDLPEAGFVEKTSGAIIILLIFLILSNALAIFLRKKYEVKW
ncbi:MAG: phosphate ABC transporter permease PstA [Rickettsiales bacterium]|nr:phosphate ABC transporter permease PstA [Rickettsiales bacterium]